MEHPISTGCSIVILKVKKYMYKKLAYNYVLLNYPYCIVVSKYLLNAGMRGTFA